MTRKYLNAAANNYIRLAGIKLHKMLQSYPTCVFLEDGDFDVRVEFAKTGVTEVTLKHPKQGMYVLIFRSDFTDDEYDIWTPEQQALVDDYVIWRKMTYVPGPDN